MTDTDHELRERWEAAKACFLEAQDLIYLFWTRLLEKHGRTEDDFIVRRCERIWGSLASMIEILEDGLSASFITIEHYREMQAPINLRRVAIRKLVDEAEAAIAKDPEAAALNADIDQDLFLYI